MKSTKVMKIKVLAQGPYEISGNIPLNRMTIISNTKGQGESWQKETTYPISEEPYHLCRCGHSQSKPFCDGTHTHITFIGTEVADKTPYDKQALVYEGQTVNLMDQESLCAVARFCDRMGGVWELVARSANPKYEEIALYEACSCPSGRLTIIKKNGEKIEPPLECEISLIEDQAKNCKGPLWVKGGILIEDTSGDTYEARNRVTLCRCGESANMPFCDASHLTCPHMQGLDKD